jgi:transcriptional regulator with XRE-family HTH domain
LTIDEEVRRAADLLEALIQAVGVPHRELEALLEVAPGYVERVLSGRIELKLRHIHALLRALEVEPHLFFQTLYPAPGAAGEVVRLDDLRQWLDGLGIFGERPPGPEIGVQDLEKLVQGAVHAALARRAPRSEEP